MSNEDFLKSLDADRWIFHADILVDKAHVVMLAEQRIIERDEASAILSALKDLERRSEEFVERELPMHEDVHTAIEASLINSLGEDVGGRMHTARSRNDEVATCIRIALREELLNLGNAVNALRHAILSRASEEVETVMPGYTHLQHAQPTTLSHHLIAHFDAFSRDFERINEAFKRTNRCPLGAAALAGTGFPINRERTAELLGFDGIVENTIDAVSTRDFIVDALACCANLMLNLSRLAEEMILWSTSEFSFVSIGMTTGSSIMPQKRNPDYAELVRAKAGTVFGCLSAALAILKALPFSYNRDLQEVTPHLLKALRTTRSSVEVMREIVSNAEFNRERMREEAEKGAMFATELADTLVRNHGIAFRTAHRIVSDVVASFASTDAFSHPASKSDSSKSDSAVAPSMSPEKVHEALERKTSLTLSEEEIRDAMDIRKNIERRKTIGGPASEEVKRVLEKRKKVLSEDIDIVKRNERKLREALEKLEREVEKWIQK